MRLFDPMLPTTAGPVHKPMRILSSGLPSAFHFALSSVSFFCISIQDRQATSAWLTSGLGAPNKAMMASPSNLSTVPSWARIISVISVKNSFKSSTSSTGVSFSEMLVNPWTSEKNAVITRFSPPRTSFSGDWINWLTTEGAI